MKTLNYVAILAISFSLSALATSCTSEEMATADETTVINAATDEAQAANVNDEVISTADDYLNALDATSYSVKSDVASGPQKVSITKVIDGVTITIDRVGLNDYPKNICVDFGTVGITVKRGNVLKGKIYINVSAKMTTPNSTRTFTFSNFSVNDNVLKGGKTVTYNGLNVNSKPYWTITAKDTLVRADKSIVTWTTNRTRTRIDDNNTLLIFWDDMYEIRGSSSGVNGKGVAYSMVIDDSKPLLIGGGYPFFTKGVVTITSDKKTALVDFGDGTKDTKATVTVNGVSKEITLKK